MLLFLETSDLICQAESMYKKTMALSEYERACVCGTKSLDFTREHKPKTQF